MIICAVVMTFFCVCDVEMTKKARRYCAYAGIAETLAEIVLFIVHSMKG